VIDPMIQVSTNHRNYPSTTLSTSNMSDSTHPENENFDELFPESSHSQKAFWQRIKTTLESQQAAISQQQEINASQQAMLTRVDSLLAAQETLINPPAPIPLMEDPYIDIHPYRVETKVALAVFREEYQALICFIQKPIPSDIAVTFGNIRTMQSTRRTFSTMDEIKAALGAWSAIASSSLMIPNYASRQTLSDAEQNELNRDYSKLKNGIKKLYEYLLHLCESSNIIQMVAYFDAVQTVCCLRRIETDVMLGADVFISGQGYRAGLSGDVRDRLDRLKTNASLNLNAGFVEQVDPSTLAPALALAPSTSIPSSPTQLDLVNALNRTNELLSSTSTGRQSTVQRRSRPQARLSNPFPAASSRSSTRASTERRQYVGRANPAERPRDAEICLKFQNLTCHNMATPNACAFTHRPLER
jgi:hypothetical protein